MRFILIIALAIIGGVFLYKYFDEKPRKNVDSGYYDNSESDEDVNSDVSENSEENSVSQDETDFQDAFNAIKNEKHLNYIGNEINSSRYKNDWIDLVGDGINQPGVDRYYYKNAPFSGEGYTGNGYQGISVRYYYRNGYLMFIEQKNMDQYVVLAETQLNVYGTKVKDGYLTNTGAWFGDFIGINKIFEGY